MKNAIRNLALIVSTVLLAGPTLFAQQSLPYAGKISIFGSTENTKYDDGTTRDFSEITTWINFRSKNRDDEDGFDYAFNLRASAYPSSEGRDNRKSLYDAWIGRRMANDHIRVRLGQMWINDLGGLGSVGGLMAEYRSTKSDTGKRFRAGLFGGVEPTIYDVDYVTGVKKGGAWIALDGANARRHVLGYVLIKDESLTERSVLTTTNFIPVGSRFFIYQTAEYDLDGPGGTGNGGLNYIFANARFRPASRLELMANYHKGRSIDARTITQDILNGRPVTQKALDGFLYESAGGRITFEVMRNVRVYAGYASDKNNRDDKSTGRVTAGLWANDIAGSGFDLTVSDNRIDRPNGAYDSWYVSLGRSFGSRLYLSGDYATSLSIVQITDSTGAVVVNRPQTDRFGINAVWNITRAFSLIVNAEQLKDNTSTDDRLQLGLTWRF